MIPRSQPFEVTATDLPKQNKNRDYHQQLHPWCIISYLPKSQNTIVARFRRRNNAEDHMQVLQRMLPGAKYSIIFDQAMGN